MKALILNAMDPETNPNPEIVDSAMEAFRRIGPPDDIACAARGDFEPLAARLEPELILAISSQIQDELAARLAMVKDGQNTTVGWWLTDDPYEIDANLPRAQLLDFVATNDLSSAGLYSGTSVIHVPLAADRHRHFREVRSNDGDYRWDVVFCGMAFSNRESWIKAAAPILARYKTLVIGPGWPRLPFTFRRRINNAELAELYNASRIVLNLPRSFNVANERDFPASTPAPRTFEAAAAGGFQLAAADRPELHRYFEIPAEMDLFLSVRDLQTKIEHYLGNPGDRIAAARRAQRRTLESHLYEHRAAVILDHVRRLRASRPVGAALPLSSDRSPTRQRENLAVSTPP